MDASAARLVEAAYEDHRAGLERHLASLTRDPGVGQDLAQESFYRLARQVEAGYPPDNIAGWLHRVGTNLATSRGRHLQVVERRAASLPEPAAPRSPEALVIEAERRAAMRSILSGMTGAEQRALGLAAYGLSGLEVADAIGRSPAATRTFICRVRSKLRDRLRQAEAGSA